MKVLIVGSNGQIGQEICELAGEQGIEFKGYSHAELDITVVNTVSEVITSDIDVVINAAAFTNVDQAEAESASAYAVNRDGVKNLAIACKQHAIPLIHISTDYVFAGDAKQPYQEDDATGPINVYGKSKLAGEKVLAATWEEHVIVRVSLVFGRYGNNFVKRILKLADEQGSLEINAELCSCPTAARDVARVLLSIASQIKTGKGMWGIYHYGGMPAVSRYEFVRQVLALAHKAVPVQKVAAESLPMRAARPAYSALAIEKICEDYGIKRCGYNLDWFFGDE
ncbi:MAG: dTDP-4-dehydrorhamnose reductase [Gammaproteobacteria bacterium]|nr:dTDP-4-dehydrorhamnose reductase [Gammaproteobacteria bacterium]